MDKRPLIILTGPTCVGKTSLSIQLAKQIGGEIISADSMQVYKHMDIGTAKITNAEMDGVRHHLIGEFEPHEEFNVVVFQKYAKKYIEDIYSRGKIPLVVGGTGFYIQALLYDIDFTQSQEDPSYTKQLEQLLAENGAEYLHDLLKSVDPESAEAIHPNNSKKVIRALEYLHLTGEKISVHNKEQRQKTSPYEYCYFVLNRDRSKLYADIDRRVDHMIEQGILEEVKALASMGYTADMVSMQGLGYKEILSYLAGECTLEEAIYLLKRDTRHYAKRQLTWFKRESDVIWIDKEQYGSEQEILKDILEKLKQHRILE